MDRKRLSRTELMLQMVSESKNVKPPETNDVTAISIIKEASKHDFILLQEDTDNIAAPTTTISATEICEVFQGDTITVQSESDIFEKTTDENQEETNIQTNLRNNAESEFRINNEIPANVSPIFQVIATDVENYVNNNLDESDNKGTNDSNSNEFNMSAEEHIPLSEIKKRNVKKRKNKMCRKERAKLKAITKHPLRDPCKDTCKKECKKLVSSEQRKLIHKTYWSLAWLHQRKFILNSCSRMPVKKRTLAANSQRNMTFCYRLLQATGKYVDVCKTFYLATLGYHPKNDKAIFNVLHKSAPGSIVPNEDQRGKNPPPNKIDRQAVLSHVEQFHPTISHHRREHAPRVRYLPSDITVAIMHKDFLEKFPQFKCGYEAYRKILFAENIRFTKLGHEECENCEIMNLHEHDRETLKPECPTCKNWSKHINRANIARNLYRNHADVEYDSKTVCVSADLEKIIMLPRMETFKKVLFTQRLVVYNESFVPLGTKNKEKKPFAVLWHEAIRGRGKEELVSTFFQFILHYRDAEHFIFWLDNCSAQNKNWAFMTFLIYIVNLSKVAAQSVEIYYFEPGHTFMSADSLHHQIELSLKRQKKTSDFNDFITAVQKSNNGKVTTKVMNINEFYDFKDFTSTYKRNSNNNEKILLANIFYVKALRGCFDLKVKCDLENDEDKTLNILRSDIYKTKNTPDPVCHKIPCGVSQEKKLSIITNLLGLMDENRKDFWINLPVTDTSSDRADNSNRMGIKRSNCK